MKDQKKIKTYQKKNISISIKIKMHLYQKKKVNPLEIYGPLQDFNMVRASKKIQFASKNKPLDGRKIICTHRNRIICTQRNRIICAHRNQIICAHTHTHTDTSGNHIENMHCSCYLQHFGAGNCHFHGICNSFDLEPFIFHGICNILVVEIIILHGILKLIRIHLGLG